VNLAGRDPHGIVLPGEEYEQVRDQIIEMLRGLYHEEARKGNIHSSQTGNLLSGAPLASGGEIRSGTSFDQVIAQAHRRATKVPSLVLGCERANPSVHKNYSMLYSSHISWSSPTTPTPLELYPALAFDRLFKDDVERGDASVLDAVIEEDLEEAQEREHARNTVHQRQKLDAERGLQRRMLVQAVERLPEVDHAFVHVEPVDSHD